jgi:enolase
MKITHIQARWILDSRGVPTIEADVRCENGTMGRAAVPSGASTGAHEVHELRDGGAAFSGQGVDQAIANVEGEVANALRTVPADDQYLIDRTMIQLDGTPNKSRLGANALLAVSLAAAHAAAAVRQVPLYRHISDIAHNSQLSLPRPMMNVLNGGRHATQSSDFQEYMIIPLVATSYAEAVHIGSEIFQALKAEVLRRGSSSTVGDEGGFTLPVTSNTEMLDVLMKATEAAGYAPGSDIGFALDIAASEFFKDGAYTLATEGRRLLSSEMIQYIDRMTYDYPIVSVEDGLDQDDWAAWSALTEKLGDLQLVGDDLLVTNQARIQQAVDQKAGNAVLIKPNQIGTLTETVQAIALAKQSGWRTVVSHRSGETEDVSIAHIAVGTGAGQIKTGSLSRGERTAKHNELMRIEAADNSLALAQPFTINQKEHDDLQQKNHSRY